MKTELPVRKKNRKQDYDYASAGVYFVTICIAERVNLLWEDIDEHGEYWALSKYGKTVEQEINGINKVYSSVHIDKYCIMPDHIHMIVTISRGELCSPADIQKQEEYVPSLSRIIKQFKGSITKKMGFSIWQKTYYDHIIRNESEYSRIWQYIEDNPINRLRGESSRNTLTFLD